MKNVLITGATSGIGKATASALAGMGYQVVLLARDKLKAEAVKNEIITRTGNNSIGYIIADQTSVKEVKQCAATYIKNFKTLDILINNAGVCLPERRITPDGMEESFEINHLSHFILTSLLIDTLANSDDPRIINVSSGAHTGGIFDPENFQGEKHYSSFTTYASTKLYNILFTFELAERLKDSDIKVNALHPGVVRTEFAHEFKGIFRMMLNLYKPFMLSPEKGAETSIYLATSEDVRNITGKYFVRCRAVEPGNKAITRENRKILWKKSLELSGL